MSEDGLAAEFNQLINRAAGEGTVEVLVVRFLTQDAPSLLDDLDAEQMRFLWNVMTEVVRQHGLMVDSPTAQRMMFNLLLYGIQLGLEHPSLGPKPGV